MALPTGFILIFFNMVFMNQIMGYHTAVVNWKFGKIQGISKQLLFDGKLSNLSTFLGIPYAQPPVGDLRFKKSKPIEYLYSPFDATMFGNQCVQFVDIPLYPGTPSEDCLYLNIYVPAELPVSDERYAVAIWIHGGGFLEGNGNVYNGSFIALYGNVIVVTINYRLGPYGFLSTEDDNAPGNNAYWDQHMAFQWVHDNIKDFGGDNERVTIFGESVGAISVIQHGFITQNRDLFQRIIAQSGSPLSPLVPNADKNALEEAKGLGRSLHCDLSATKLLMSCLRNKSNEDILDAMKTNGIPANSFRYVIDDVLIKRDVKSILVNADKMQVDELMFFRSIDVINGFNSFEGVHLYSVEYNPSDKFQVVTLSREEILSRIRVVLKNIFGDVVHASVIEMVMAEYTNWSNLDSMEEVHIQLTKLCGDLGYETPAIITALLHRLLNDQRGNYFYHFVANPSVRPLRTPEWIPGANHADELYFVFGMEGIMIESDPETTWEIQLSRKIVRYWTNFMKSGNPNKPVEVYPTWPECNTESIDYLKLEEKTTNESVGRYLYARETNFWYNVYPGIKEALERKTSNVTECEDHTSSSASLSPLAIVHFILGVVLVFIIHF